MLRDPPPHPPTEAELRAVHEALIASSRAELAAACDPARPDGLALIVLPHGSPEAQIAFGSRDEVARELRAIAAEEGPAAIGLEQAAAALPGIPPAPATMIDCIVIALGQARLYRIPRPLPAPPSINA